jgi:hypothetical protein
MSAKGEKYKSMAAMKKHEKNEPMAMKMKEYGAGMPMKKTAKKKTVKKVAKKAMKRGMFGGM